MHRELMVTSSKNGYGITREDFVYWRWYVGESVEVFLSVVGHPCCWRGIGKIPPLGWLSYKLLNWAEGVRHKNRVTVGSIPITEQEYKDLGMWDDLDEFMSTMN